MTTILVQDLPLAPPPTTEVKFTSPQALTPEVIVFLAMLCFLAMCGAIRQ